jgi:ACS family glucarate transporter-like MFS transporter
MTERTPSASDRAPLHSWVMLVALIAPATLIMAMDRAVLTVSAPILQTQFGLSLPQLGLLFTVFFWAYAFMQVPAGLIITRIGSRWSLFCAILLWSLMTAITPFTATFMSLAVTRALLGMGQAADWPASIVGINRLFAVRQRPIANSILLFSLYAGPVIGAPLTGHMLGVVGLRGLFVIFGAVGFVFAAVWLTFYRDGAGASSSVKPAESSAAPAPGSLRTVTRAGRCWALAASYFFTGVIISFYLSWFPIYLVKARHLGMKEMGVYTGLLSAALCVAVLTAGRVLLVLTRRTRSLRSARVPVGMASLLVAGASSCVVPLTGSDSLALVVACAAIAALGFSQVATWSVVQDIGGKHTGALAGLVAVCGNFAAGATPFVSAQIVEHTGTWTGSFLVLGGTGIAGAIAWYLIHPDHSLDDAHDDGTKVVLGMTELDVPR